MNPPAAALFDGLNALCQSAAPALLDKIGQALQTAASDMPLNELLARLPGTNNSDAYFQLLTLLGMAQGLMTWSEFGWSLQAIADAHIRQQREQRLELVWTGPRLENAPALRRLDQALYDLIGHAQRTVLLMTFAASKITRLNTALSAAAARGVAIRLILEFEEESGGQLSRDALTAFAGSVERQAEIYYWPLEQRERNAHGKPGKLHAKCAVVDDAVLVSSANLADDAFNRNIEMGVLLRVPALAEQLERHFGILIEAGVLKRLIENE
jgi:phosphatidylserine/phosphatidylglycerophosphate/cardiolipin synthase-like enzyme